MNTQRTREVAAATAVAALLLVLVLQHRAGDVVNAATGALALVVGVRWLRASRPAEGRLRVGLRLLGTGFAGWSVGQALWLAHADTVGTVVFDSAASLMAAGAAWMAASRRLGSIRAALDGLIMTASLMLISWVVVLGPMYRAGGGSLAMLASAGAYPLADVLIGSITLLMLYEVRGPRRRSVAFAACGLLFVLVSDTAYAWQMFAGTYASGGLLDLGWFAGFAVVGAGAPRADEIVGSSAMVTDGRSFDLMPYVPFGAALGTAVTAFALHHGQVEPALFVLTVVLTALITVRQLLSLRDNRRLNQQLAEAVEDLRHRAYHDPLTGLPNRSLLLDTLRRRPSALLYVDLDGFKPVNDTHGHDAGDEVLVVVADRLRACAGEDGLVARLGGDEFAVALPAATAAAAHAAARLVVAAVAQPIPVRGGTVSVGASVGVAAYEPDVEELLRHADAAMYAAKLSGRNRATRCPAVPAVPAVPVTLVA